MLFYFIKRILWAIPTLLLISILVFGLTKCAADDPVEKLFPESSGHNVSWQQQANNYKEKAAFLGLDKPYFYFTISPSAYPDTFYRIFPPNRREWLDDVLGKTGKTTAAFDYLKHINAAVHTLERDTAYVVKLLTQKVFLLQFTDDLHLAKAQLLTFQKNFPQKTSLFTPCISALTELESGTNWASLLTPRFRWHGYENQFHSWLFSMFRGEWGTSYVYGTDVWKMLTPLLGRTLILNGFSLFFSLLLSIPLGLWLARNQGTKMDSIGQRILVGLHAVPVFWLASILVLLFASTFGLQLFDYGCSSLGSESIWMWFRYGNCLILPIFCQTILTMAVLALQMRASAVDISKKDFVRTARAKGLSERSVWRRHVLPNALFPMITLFSGVLPALFGGSIIIEYMFDIPGIGAATFHAFVNDDHPVLFAIVMITAVLTLVGTLLADLMYAYFDPRVRY